MFPVGDKVGESIVGVGIFMAQNMSKLIENVISKVQKEVKYVWWRRRWQGAVSIRKTVLPGMAIPMLKIRRPNGRLIFNMEIAIRR